ncbi:1,6-anhydro-N-acetylmuramyl-L-alanine amidase AmpD [Hydrogenophaga sp. PAMC20947]|uniref:1,6-anhydro-N-acetylmuramyl-L-alanine amidase AmpD n=1 Tax=Hydrogenophaga sp. PAMC20947 TaxID=2565558 RepID=UPI00109DFA39|nr:1,6-anhydro-N-acetylmuramyl-L-alanine amidase AmpD [Hydrogenophaga sp. PAMC20947]QCB48215.1 1,6-anhydro-N-acetylmuramyl-L-alanine amidase AmpD [Hydrogenophaga sp. PAMC20947]
MAIHSDALTHVAPLWDGGWLRMARHSPSPNWGPRPIGACIDLLVVHSISLPPGVYGGPQVEQLFTNQLDWDAHPYFDSIRGMEVSAHFFLRRDGELVQFVDADARAWHAGASEWRGRCNCNDDSIGIELEGLEGGDFEEAQYQRLGELCRALQARYPVQHIAGHEHIAPGRKRDPGPGFDWVRFQGDLGWNPASFPPVPGPRPSTT